MKLYKMADGRCNMAGIRIRELRSGAKLSQEALAARIQATGHEITQKAVSRIESGERVLPDYELFFFAEALGVEAADLLKE